MNTLKAHLKSLNFATQLGAVNDLLNCYSGVNTNNTSQIKTKISFLGTRLVEVNGYKGPVSLDFLAKRILGASNQRCKADDLTPAERIAGVEIVRKLKNLYKITDPQINYSNFLTRFLNWIREFSFIPYTTRFYLSECAEGYFRGFGETKFIQQFGKGPNGKMDQHPASDGAFGPPYRIMAKEDRIRALLVRV
ncbi:MAG: hypothetical protein HZB76_07290 [Chlamydiae bacterium]|nr:hypothetical protein [Chlamydiota bacterium]